MLRCQGSGRGVQPVPRYGVHGLLALSAIAMAGCSTDFRRLEQPSYGLTERAGPRPSEPIGGRRYAGGPTGTNETWTDSGPRAPLPPVTGQVPSAPLSTEPIAPSTPRTAGLSQPFDRPKPAQPANAAAGARAPILAGPAIEVAQGDTLYGLSKKHNVSIAALMEVNQLKSPNLKPGQKLVLPGNARRPAVKSGTQVASAGAALPPSVLAAPVAPAPVAAAPVAPSAPTLGQWGGSYTVKPGDSLYAVARSHKVALAELQRMNNIADPTKVRPGTVLKVPGTTGTAGLVAAVGEPSRPAPVTPAAVTPAPAAPATPAAIPPVIPPAAAPPTGMVAPRIINSAPAVQPAPVAAATEPAASPQAGVVPPVAPTGPGATPPVKVASAATTAVAAAPSAKYRWPVKGPVLSKFGPRANGTQNDGIDISVPAGTDVAAVADGTVAYAGSELKGYGNLVLVRHDDGLVSAYAHASEILVKRGDAVKRGQVIAKSGQTGTIDQPMLHFEVRQGSKPVDPLPYLEKN